MYGTLVTVYRALGLRSIIFVDDHAPAHVHVFGDGHANTNLLGADGAPEIVNIEGMKRGDVRHAMQIASYSTIGDHVGERSMVEPGMVELGEAQPAFAEERGRFAAQADPRAIRARYDLRRGGW